jgi:hypothetical protein
MSEKDYDVLKSRGIEMGLNWQRIYGVAIERHEDCWDSILEVLEDCVDAATKALTNHEDPHAAVRTRLVACLTSVAEDLLDDGYYDREDYELSNTDNLN